jgi:hypothetical protein
MSWRDCAQQWASADDDERAETAERYSYGDRYSRSGPGPLPRRLRGLRQQPFVADRLQ